MSRGRSGIGNQTWPKVAHVIGEGPEAVTASMYGDNGEVVIVGPGVRGHDDGTVTLAGSNVETQSDGSIVIHGRVVQ